ncbi:T-cell receptor gamma chain V region V108A [Platysternon megacephalum]|nr:T-cell receptor gamma chain V region V108A [Platysternon megacephalum]
MLLVQVLIVASIWSYGAAQVQLTQDQLSITRKPTKTVRIDCKVSGINFGDAYIHWYRQRPGEAPEWILYFKSHTQGEQSHFDKEKFSVDKTTEKSTCTLTVDKLTYNDRATYYCAYWDRTVLERHRQAVQNLTLYSEPQTYKSRIPSAQTDAQNVDLGHSPAQLTTESVPGSSPDGEAQVLVQSQLSITKAEDRTARIDCHVSGITLSSANIHWYRQRPDAALERILYFSSGNPVFDQDSEKGKFEADKQLSKSTCTLTVKKTTKSDTATYYCAAWDHTALKKHSHSVPKPTLYSQLQSFKYMKPQLLPNPASHDRTRRRNPLLVSATRDKKQQNGCSHKFCKKEDPTCVCQTNNKTT